MEESQSQSAKDQLSSSTTSGNAMRKSIQRYPLRSASKLKDVQPNKSPEFVGVNSSSKRARPPPAVSKSISVLELSSSNKSGKPPRRLSIPTKSIVNPKQKPIGNITPISEVRSRRSADGQDRCDTPLSDVSKSSTSIRRKFNILTSTSYWVQQIKLSESVAKHSISLGFFKLALEAQSEPLQLLREELKSYVRKHNLAGHEETVRTLFESYEVSETLEQLQTSETCSYVPEESSTPSNEGVQSTISTSGTRKLKPKSLNTDTQASSAKASSKKEIARASATKNKASVMSNPRLAKGSASNDNIKKKVQKPGKQEPDDGGEKVKDQEEKSVAEEAESKPLEIEETQEENKENLDAPLIGEISVT